MRLIVNRPQMVEQALAGYGRIANDLFSPYDPAYFHGLPQRHQDIDKAKALLKEAGQQNLTVNLQTAPFTTGAVEAAQVFAAQAKAANVTVNIQQLETGVFFGPNYTKYLFALDYYFVRNYLPQVSFGMITTAPFNETHWPDAANSEYASLYKEAKETFDRQKRTALIHRMQQMEYDSGGLIVWGFVTFVDAYNSRVTGLMPDAGVRLSRYGLKGVSFV
jgi:peptide/nickel transport system substrate-binding protein